MPGLPKFSLSSTLSSSSNRSVSRVWWLVLLAFIVLIRFISHHQERLARTSQSSIGNRLPASLNTIPNHPGSSVSSLRVNSGAGIVGPLSSSTYSISTTTDDGSSTTSSRRSSSSSSSTGNTSPTATSSSWWSILASYFSFSSSSSEQSSSSASSSSPSSSIETIHIAYTACGIPNDTEEDMYGLLSLKSLLLARSNSLSSSRYRYMFHIISSSSIGELLNTTSLNYDVKRAIEDDPYLDMRIYSLDDLDYAVRQLGDDPDLIPHTIFKPCAASRLKLPYILYYQYQLYQQKDYVKLNKFIEGTRFGKFFDLPSSIIYLDWDTLVTCDLVTLYHHFTRFNSSQYIGFALNDPTGQSEKDIYKEWNLPRPIQGAISSGIMMLDVEKLFRNNLALLHHYWSAMYRVIEDKVPNATKADFWVLTNAFPLGDQDVLNVYLHNYNDKLYLIPPEYNWCLADLVPFRTYKEKYSSYRPIPCIYHVCGQRLFTDMMKQSDSPDDKYIKGLFNYIKYAYIGIPEPPPGVYVPPDTNL